MSVAGQGSIKAAPYDRLSSFIERYVIERASTFTKGKELEDGWRAVQNAKKIYQMIADGVVERPIDNLTPVCGTAAGLGPLRERLMNDGTNFP
jgi:hypothetical protein